MIEPGTRSDSSRQFASANAWGSIPASAASSFRVSPVLTMYAYHPLGGSQLAGSPVGVPVIVGLGERVVVGVGNFVAVDVGISLDWLGELV